MSGQSSRVPSILSLVGSVLGLLFASYSTLDYAHHLDRRLHEVHCSFIPGAPATAEGEACRAAMYSPYSAVMRDSLWGGIPISLFALGAFAFFAGFSVYLMLARQRASRTSWIFFAVVGITPLLVSILMFTISVTKIGAICKTCVGTYIASALLAVGSLLGFLASRKPSSDASGSTSGDAVARPNGNPAMAALWLLLLGALTILPVGVYAASAPDHRPYLTQCGELKKPEDPQSALLKFRGAAAVQPALFFEDPLCPTCKAFHQRLEGEGVLEKLDVTLTLFPLDSSCNWMLDQPLHPGSCLLSKAILCGKGQARQMLEWAFDKQTDLARAGKQSDATLKAMIQQKWGSSITSCIDSRETKVQLNNHLHFAAENQVPVSTPQVYLGSRRICDEDTDLGLRYTLKQLAPEVLK
ncbi:MAG TPA: vitamin K epoxide reductase family protein [Polyangiaceae bacterium]